LCGLVVLSGVAVNIYAWEPIPVIPKIECSGLYRTSDGVCFMGAAGCWDRPGYCLTISGLSAFCTPNSCSTTSTSGFTTTITSSSSSVGFSSTQTSASSSGFGFVKDNNNYNKKPKINSTKHFDVPSNKH